MMRVSVNTPKEAVRVGICSIIPSGFALLIANFAYPTPPENLGIINIVVGIWFAAGCIWLLVGGYFLSRGVGWNESFRSPPEVITSEDELPPIPGFRKICTTCEANIPLEAGICPKCGAPFEKEPSTPDSTEEESG